MKINFDYKLVQINLPKSLSKDYLANVALYHELGHFIDSKFQISKILAYISINSKVFDSNVLKNYIDLSQPLNSIIIENYFAEYFSDLFASQYIGLNLSKYLNHISNYQIQNWSNSHPATEVREKLIADFCNGTNNEFINYIKKIAHQSCNKKIEIQFEKVDSKDIYNFLPLIIDNDKQLHYLFILGWEIWLEGDTSKFKKANNLQFELKPDKLYQVLNNLIEKSIGNFIISKQWNNAIDKN
ncbi:MAG: hypothetical protein EAZ27_00650 [Cytophagales bacterium]|nr:MAG: hypothetical protein EAZ27_00650 [Cytophagales bacterium]